MRQAETLLAHPKVPAFVTEIVEDRRALLGLLAACAAIGAAGLDPHVFDPGAVRGERLLDEEPALQPVLSLAAIAQAAFFLVGGAVADIWRSERLLGLALLGLAVASVGAVLMPGGLGLVASRVLAWACVGLIVPFAVGIVAILYKGTARATALGALFGVYGAASAAAPFLSTAFGRDGPEIQAFGLAAAVALIASWAARNWLPDLPGALFTQRRLIVTTVLWALGVIVLAMGVLLNGELWMIVPGVALIALALLVRHLGRTPSEARVDRRRVSAALVAGLVVGFSQVVPMMALPQFFTNVQNIPSLIATVLIAPFVLGLLVTGPLAGFLLQRFRPRILVIIGVWAVAVADLAFAALMHPTASYLWFIIPFLMVGSGFVIANVIRTAVIFASTPQQLPATAAALNESSIGVGARVGAVLVVLIRTHTDDLTDLLGERVPADILESALADGSELFWLRIGLVIAGFTAVIGGIVVTILLGARDPLGSVWDLREERTKRGGAPPG